jgi:hypothetical protein
MKTRFQFHRRFFLFSLSILGCSALIGEASAQLNESKIERDATGIYSGGIKAGKVLEAGGGLPSETFTTTPYTGKVKVPVKDGKLSTVLTDPDVETSDSKAVMKGKEKKSTVQRGGNRVSVEATGTVSLTGSPKWTGASIKGNIDDKGTKWTGDCEAKGKKVFPPYMFDPDDDPMTDNSYLVPESSFTVSGLDVDGKG